MITNYEWKQLIYNDVTQTLYKMLGCFNPILGQKWTNSNIGLKNVTWKCNPMAVILHIFDPKWG